jgi:hypothetical protein
MSGFTQHIDSPFPDENILFNSASGITGQQIRQNDLMNQGRQLDLTTADHEQVGRLAAGLLNEPDLAKRADLYARGVGYLQSQNLAKYAPPTLPDEGVLRSLVNQSVPVADQYKMGLITAPGLTDALSRSNAPLPGQPGYGASTGAAPGTAAAPGTIEPDAQTRAMAVRDGFIKRGMDPDTATAFAANALHESAANPNTGPGDGGASQGLFMWNGPRNTAFQQIYGHTPQGAPLDEQLDFVMHELNGSESLARDRINQAQGVAGKAAQVSEAYLRPKDTAPEMQRRSATALQLQRQLGGGVGTASTAPAGGGRVQMASAAPTVPVTATDGTTAPPGPPAVSAPAPGATTAAAPAATAAPASTAQPAPSTGTGTQSPQFQAALEMNRRATALETQFPYSPQAKAQAASLRAQAALYMQADSVSVDPVTGIQTKQLTGERLNAAAPNAHYVWNQDQGAYVDTTGVHPPVTPPSPRLTATPGGDILQSKPGGGATVVYSTNPQDITRQEAAKTAGAALGTAGVKQVADLANQGRTAAQAIGNIDYGMSQVQKAKAGGINTGYFAPWLSTIGAIAKSIGGDTGAQLLGIDPTAVGNTQTAAKTLAVVSGAILNQILGPESQVTDAKIQHFIHAQPGIETDPDALGRVLNWARTQFVYEREMAAQGMKDAKSSGALPPGWQANYFDQHGFAPIYNPGTGEMQQPEGQAPSRTAPATLSVAPINPADRKIGTIYITKNLGPATWTEQGWLKAQ